MDISQTNLPTVPTADGQQVLSHHPDPLDVDAYVVRTDPREVSQFPPASHVALEHVERGSAILCGFPPEDQRSGVTVLGPAREQCGESGVGPGHESGVVRRLQPQRHRVVSLQQPEGNPKCMLVVSTAPPTLSSFFHLCLRTPPPKKKKTTCDCEFANSPNAAPGHSEYDPCQHGLRLTWIEAAGPLLLPLDLRMARRSLSLRMVPDTLLSLPVTSLPALRLRRPLVSPRAVRLPRFASGTWGSCGS